MLPLGPLGYGNSPYSSTSAFAGNPLLISLERLAEHGWIDPAKLDRPVRAARVEYDQVFARKMPLLFEAAELLRSGSGEARGDSNRSAQKFLVAGRFCFVRCASRRHKLAAGINGHMLCASGPAALKKARQELADDMQIRRALQFAFYEQWRALSRYCSDRGDPHCRRCRYLYELRQRRRLDPS